MSFNVTKIYDQPGWAFYFIANDMKKYSKGRIVPQQWNKIDYNLQDIVIISGPNISYTETAIDIPKECKRRGIKTIGMMCGEYDILYQGVDLIVTISPQLYLYAKKKYKDTPVIFLPEGICCDYFQPSEKFRTRFVSGWAGGYKGKPFKRAELLTQLKYPTRIQADHGQKFFVDGRTQQPMKDFYASIDCFINLSTTEALPRVILESLACGLPVISTDVGGVPLLLPDNKWIIPITDSIQTVTDTNKLLDELASSFELREAIGKVNRAWAEKVWSWEHIMPIYDEVFYYLIGGNISKIEEIGESVIDPFKKYFEPCEKYTKQISNFPTLKVENKQRIASAFNDHMYVYLIEELTNFPALYWIAKRSCLDVVNRQKIVLDMGTIWLGVQNQQDKCLLIEYLIKKGAIGTSEKLVWKILEIYIIIEHIEHTKQMLLYGKNVPVPMPVVPYLYENFGILWRNK